MEKRNCPECKGPVFGRTDKKFCSDYCRNSFNNKANAASNNHIRNINNRLAKNRKILSALNPHGKLKIHKEQLIKKGFDFSFHTHTYSTKAGDEYIFCYEQGYLLLEAGYVLLVQRNER